MGFLHGVEKGAPLGDRFSTWCRKVRATRGEIFHGVEKGAQVCDGFTTWCSKGRANRRFLKNQCIKLINSNMSLTIQNTQGVATLCPGLCACCPFRAESTYSINLSKRLCQNSFVSLRARPAIPYYLDSHDRMRCRVKPGKTRRERLHHFDTPTSSFPLFIRVSLTSGCARAP